MATVCWAHSPPAIDIPVMATNEMGMVNAHERMESAVPKRGSEMYPLEPHTSHTMGMSFMNLGGLTFNGHNKLQPSLVSMSPRICTMTPKTTQVINQEGPSGNSSVVKTPKLIPATHGAFRARAGMNRRTLKANADRMTAMRPAPIFRSPKTPTSPITKKPATKATTPKKRIPTMEWVPFRWPPEAVWKTRAIAILSGGKECAIEAL